MSRFCRASSDRPLRRDTHIRSATLLPILRSQHQAEPSPLLLGASTARSSGPGRFGLLASPNVGRTRIVRAVTTSPYFAGLADVMTKAFRSPQLLAAALSEVDGIDCSFLYVS